MVNDFELFKAWIHAIIEEKINDALGRDSLMEALNANQLEAELIKVVSERNDDN